MAEPSLGADELPSPCDARENPAVCQLKIQRNDALDNLALARGDLRGEKTIEERTAEYWRKYRVGIIVERAKDAAYWRRYVAGLPDGAELEKHIRAACAWRGAQARSTSELCAWWRKESGK